LEVNLDVDPDKASWDRAIQIFKFHQAHITSAEKGIEILERFRDYIEKRLASQKGKLSKLVYTIFNYTDSEAEDPSSSAYAETPASGTVGSGETSSTRVTNDIELNPSEDAWYNFETLLGSDLPSDAWFTMQDFQLDDWI
jgi:hypothetical protein